MVRKSAWSDAAATVSEIEPDEDVSTTVAPHRSDATASFGYRFSGSPAYDELAVTSTPQAVVPTSPAHQMAVLV